MEHRVIPASRPVVKIFLLLIVLLLISNTVFASIQDFCDPNRTSSNIPPPAGIPKVISSDICIFYGLYAEWIPPGIMLMVVLAALAFIVGQLAGTETRAKATVWANNLIIGAILAVIIAYIIGPFLVDSLLIAAGIEHPEAGIPQLFGNVISAAVIKSLLLSALITASFYMMSHFFQHPPLTAIAKEELAATIFSAIIVWFWLASNSYLPNVIVGLLTVGSPTAANSIMASANTSLVPAHIYLASAALDILFEKMRAMYAQLYFFEVLIGFLSTLSFPLGSPLPLVNLVTFSFMPYDGLVLLSNAHTVVVEAIGFVVTALMAKQILLGFARDIIPTLLLPIGIIFRAFPMSRKTGSSLIAISFVAFYVYPMAIIFSNYLIFDVFKPADFNYVPKTLSPLGAVDPAKIKELINDEAAEKKTKLTDPDSGLGSKSLTDNQIEESCGSGFWGFWCSAKKFASNFGSIVSESVKTI